MDDETYLYLTTTGWKSGRPHEIEIWYVSLDGQHYLISELGEASHWVQNLRRQPRVLVRIGGATFPARAREVGATEEQDLHRQVCEVSKLKYGWGKGLVVELTPEDD